MSWIVTMTWWMQQTLRKAAKPVGLQQALPTLGMAASRLPWSSVGARQRNRREA